MVARNLRKLRNIGIAAHVDSGKTTLTERVLFYTGKIREPGEVRQGHGATMDSGALEKQHGITINAAATTVDWCDHTLNIIDTPGHIDFTIEVERALRVLDGAVLVLCAVSGVQSQSVTVDRQMQRYGVPCIAFVNKCDRAGADPLAVCAALRDRLGHNALMLQFPIGLEDEHRGVVDLITRKAFYFDGDFGQSVREANVPTELHDLVEQQRSLLIEALSDFDDGIAGKYIEGQEVTAAEIIPVLRAATLARKITGVCLGSAYKNKAVQLLLDKVCELLPSPLDRAYQALDLDQSERPVDLEADADEPLVMLAFKIEQRKYGQLTYFRIYQGALHRGDSIANTANAMRKTKAGRLVSMHADKMEDIDFASAGEIVALLGVDCASGSTFTDGTVRYSMASMFVPDPVVTLAVSAKRKDDLEKFAKALHRFAKEDPTFCLRTDDESGETIIGGMGELQLELYIEKMELEYGIQVKVGAPQVAYRETIRQRVEFDYTHKKQSGGPGQYARVAGHIEPLEDEDYRFVDEIVGGAIPKTYIPSCDRGFQEAMQCGALIDAPVVGVSVTIADGTTHAKDSSDMAFHLAARAAFREAYVSAKPIVLEPVMLVQIETPETFAGTVIGGINRRRGRVVAQTSQRGLSRIECEVPLASMFGYAGDLRSSTQGRAEFAMEFAKYAPVPREVQEKLMR